MRRLGDIGRSRHRSGLIGTVHVEQLRRIGVQVRGILESRPERGEPRPRRSAWTRAYPSLRQSSRTRRRCVHVTSPNHLHVEQPGKSFRREHDFCESRWPYLPGAPTSFAWPRKRPGTLSTSIRFYPLHQHVRAHAEGGLGDTRFVTGHYIPDWAPAETDWSWRLDTKAGGLASGPSADIGSHWLDLQHT